MKTHCIIIPVIACLSLGLRAQDSIILAFRSDLPLDSLRVENRSTGEEHMFAADGNMELIFDVREEVYTSSLEKGNEIDDKSVLIYPNPCSGDTRMEFITKIAGRSSLLLFGPTGKLITQKKAYLQPGAHVFSIAMNHAGIHFLKLVTPTFGFGQSVLSLGNSEGGTGIQYSSYNGERAYARGYHRKGSTKAEVKNAIPAAKGDLLRFSAYSGSRMEMLYDFLMSDSIYAFTFPEVPPGVYLRVNDSLASDLDTVHCFVSRGGVYFSTLGRDSGVFERGRLPLRPVTFGGLRKPEYRWEFKHQEIWFMDTVSNLSGDLVPKAFKEDTTTLTLHDHSNSFSKAFVMIMVPDDFVAKGVALSTIKQENTLNEISGMAASVKNPDCFWVHNDSGDEARLYLINTDGSIVSTVNLVTDHTDNRDWEDIECASFIERYRQVNWGKVFDPSTEMFATTLRNSKGGLAGAVRWQGIRDRHTFVGAPLNDNP